MPQREQAVLLTSMTSKVSVVWPGKLTLYVWAQALSGVATTVHAPPKQPPAGEQTPKPSTSWKGASQLTHDPAVGDMPQALQNRSAKPTVNSQRSPCMVAPLDVTTSTDQQYTVEGINSVSGLKILLLLGYDTPSEGRSAYSHASPCASAKYKT